MLTKEDQRVQDWQRIAQLSKEIIRNNKNIQMHSKSFHLIWLMLEFNCWLICSNVVSGRVVYKWSYLLCNGGW